MIRHMVFVRFPAEITVAERADLLSEFGGLRAHLARIADFQVRRNISPETAVVRGFEDMFWFDFEDEAARDAYLEDARHKELGARLTKAAEGGPDGVFVCDVAP